MRAAPVAAEFTIGPSGVSNVRVTLSFAPAAASCLEQHLTQLPIPADPVRWTAMYRYRVEGLMSSPRGAI